MFAPIRWNVLLYLDHKIPLEQMKYDPWDQSIIILKSYCPDTEPNMEVLEDRVSGNNPLINRETITRQMPPSSVPSETCHHDLPTYEEAVTPGPDLPTSTRIVPNIQDILHHIDYSSDPDEARIHFEILSPTRPSRSRHRNVNTRRERWRYPSTIHDHIYCDEIEIRPPSRRMKNNI